MRRRFFLALVLVLMAVSIGCGKKQQPLEEMQEPISMEELTDTNIKSQALPGAITGTAETAVSRQPDSVNAPAVFLPPADSYKPTVTQIQQALANAGFDIGKIDGKIGPMTRKAIEEFQKANNLKVDGKVGPQTWAALSAYLNKTTDPAVSQ